LAVCILTVCGFALLLYRDRNVILYTIPTDGDKTNGVVVAEDMLPELALNEVNPEATLYPSYLTRKSIDIGPEPVLTICNESLLARIIYYTGKEVAIIINGGETLADAETNKLPYLSTICFPLTTRPPGPATGLVIGFLLLLVLPYI
jgi:hypothetical protein